MASLRARLARGAGAKPPAERPLDEQYRPALTAIQALLVKRMALDASAEEIRDLEAMAASLRWLARRS
jgi:hypothetical protein